MHRHPFLERWLSNIPLLSSNPTATSPGEHLLAMLPHLAKGGLLPTCREEKRRVTDSLNFPAQFQSPNFHHPGSGSCRKHGAEWWTHKRSHPAEQCLCREPRIPAASPLFTCLEGLEGLRAPSALKVLGQVPGRSRDLADQQSRKGKTG